MHSYLRAVGFSSLQDRNSIDQMLNEICVSCDIRNAVRLENGHAFVEYEKEFAPGCGIIVCGEMDETGFHRDYYFPYFKTDTISSKSDLEIEKHSGKDSYAGICEDDRMGTTLIFYVQNAVKYRREYQLHRVNGEQFATSFMGLSTGGRILLPVLKTPQQELLCREASINRNHRIAAAKNGDEDAIESLTIEEMDTYSMISRRILHEDVLSIVDTLFMPYGMECDLYQIIGEILAVKKVRNARTKEYLYQMKVQCNNMEMDVCINEADLLGDPDVGRRFRGTIWLQGYIHF